MSAGTTKIKLEHIKIEDQQLVAPDSTTSTQERDMAEFYAGEDVLVKQKDGRYYFGTVVAIDTVREQCLVKYGDNTENWSTYKDITKLSSEQEDLLCVLCKKHSPKSEKMIVVCDQCGRGYHRKCHLPEVKASELKDESDSSWMCKRCKDAEPLRLKKPRRDSKTCSSTTHESMPTSTVKVLPYDLSKLTWDSDHRVNAEQIYCYCGTNGDWNKQMLQCGRCRQWFHEKCVDCLQFPLYCGDRFYVFICAVCNHGREFVRRLEMKWADLVHLMLYNLTIYNSKKYYDLDRIVIPYISDNWHALQIPPKMANVTKAELRENVLNVLIKNQIRFKCGRETKKRTTIWGLRGRLPPPPPVLVLPPPHREVTEIELRDLRQGNRRLQFLPLTSSAPREVVGKATLSEAAMRNLMMGVAYQQSASQSENESPCPSPEITKDERVSNSPLPFVPSKNEYLGAGCVKKTAPFKKMSLQRRKKLLALTNRERERILKRPKRLVTKKGDTAGQDPSRSQPTSTSGTAKNAPIAADALPPTPPTSVSAPPTPPASNSLSIVSDLSNDLSESSSQTKIGIKKQNLLDLELNTPCDTSSDETSSKSTLDAIIPPPKNFEGQNNPFLALLRMGEALTKSKKKGKDITLPLPLKTVIPGQPLMRPMKRQLSEKDIVVGPNGEVKRKKRFIRRSRNAAPNYTSNGRTAIKTATVVPAKPQDDWKGQSGGGNGGAPVGCLDYTFNGRRLRQRPEKPPAEKPMDKQQPITQPSPKPSPVKKEPDVDMEDLKTSVNIYFGAVNRISSGERFSVKAKRVGPAGKMECLIEWEGQSAGLT